MSSITTEVTEHWVRNEADRRAVANGCWFDPIRASFVIWWIEHFCSLYEGEWAGERLRLHGAASVDADFPITPNQSWIAAKADYLARADAYAEAYAAESVDWQYENTMQLFGWMHHSKRWNRAVRRFKHATIFVAKKNKKSPTLAAWAWYLLVGDGEQGQKVFFGAKDGRQAREIVGEHAQAMWDQSNALRASCTFNKTLMRFTYGKTRSFMQPLSSAEARSKAAKEGLNGSMLVDEVHVVDADFMARVERMGISRVQPFHIEVSTAGNDPESYGKKQADYGREVAEGKRDDQEFYYRAYQAPQDLSDERLAVDPIKFGKMANPAWGQTIDPEEFLSDYRRSRRSLTDRANFAMYRLDIWQRSAHPWIRSEDWQSCYREFDAESLKGQPCGGGFDVGPIEDMTAFSLVFPEDMDEWAAAVKSEGDNGDGQDEPELRTDAAVRLLTWYWLPEAMIDRHRHKVDFAKWVEAGLIKASPGAVIDFATVEDDIGRLLEEYDVRMLAYDERFALRSIQILMSRFGLMEAKQYKFTQSWRAYTGPTLMCDRLIRAGKWHHNGNAVTTWQSGHVQKATNMSRATMPTRPSDDSDDPRKIDGIVSGVMALDAAIRMPCNVRSYYEDHDFEYV